MCTIRVSGPFTPVLSRVQPLFYNKFLFVEIQHHEHTYANKALSFFPFSLYLQSKSSVKSSVDVVKLNSYDTLFKASRMEDFY